MPDNAIKGKDLLLEIFLASAWKVIGGIRTKEFNRDNPVADVTNQADSGNETSACYTGYSTVTINGNGTVDTRSGASLSNYKELSAIANSSDPTATLRFSDSLESFTGDFLITSFGKTGEQTNVIEFSSSFQNKGVITFVQA